MGNRMNDGNHGGIDRLALAALLALALAGCATTELQYTATDGSGVRVQTRTLFKDINDAQATWGDVQVKLGSSSGAIEPTIIACMLAPELCN